MQDFREYKAAFLEQNDLAHFGILGMHWGIRRYQNPDGSLTPAGQRRYNENASFRNKVNADKKYQKHRERVREEAEKKWKEDVEREKNSDSDDELEKSRNILKKEVYGASDKKFTSICREYYKHMKKQGRTYGLSEEAFIEHMKNDGWQDDADEWYLKKYHNIDL